LPTARAGAVAVACVAQGVALVAPAPPGLLLPPRPAAVLDVVVAASVPAVATARGTAAPVGATAVPHGLALVAPAPPRLARGIAAARPVLSAAVVVVASAFSAPSRGVVLGVEQALAPVAPPPAPLLRGGGGSRGGHAEAERAH